MKVALVDLDGMLSEGNIFTDFLEYLYNNSAYDEAAYRSQMTLLDEYKQGLLSYNDCCRQQGLFWAAGLKGQAELRITSLAIRFFSEFKENFFPVSYNLVKNLNELGFRTVCFTTAAFEVALLASRELGFDDCVGTKAVIEENFYTGSLETELHLPGGKERLAKNLLSDSSFSASFGNSSLDISCLDLVDLAFVVNPDDELKKYAETKGWTLLDLKKISSEELNYLLNSKLDKKLPSSRT